MISTLSPDGLEFLKRHEGLRLHMYEDSAGHATIGYGHLVHRGPIGSNPSAEAPYLHGLTPAQAGLILARDTLAAQRGVGQIVTRGLAQYEFDALVSLAYNIGLHAFSTSTLARRVQSCATPDAIQSSWLEWDRPHSILPRRRDEVRLFLTGQYTDARP